MAVSLLGLGFGFGLVILNPLQLGLACTPKPSGGECGCCGVGVGPLGMERSASGFNPLARRK